MNLLGTLLPVQKVSLCALLRKGDAPGHEFHGNQWTGEGEGPIAHNEVKQVAESMATELRQAGFSVQIQHSGSAAGASSYLSLYHEETGRTVIDQIRVSDHSKGAFNSQFVYPVSAHEDVPKIIEQMKGLLTQMKAAGPSSGLLQSKEVADRIARRRAKEEARKERRAARDQVEKLAKNLDAAAHSAATSTLNLRPQPTEGQRSAGNYKKGHVQFAGLKVAIENPAGSYRRPEWPAMQAHYGYVKGTEGADGDAVDVFLKPSTPLDWDGTAYVIDQPDADGNFDEHKVMLGFDSQTQAERCYLAHYPAGWKLGPVTAMSLDELKVWLSGDTAEAVAKEWSTPTSATSGIQPYGTTKSKTRRHVRLKAKEKQA